MTDLGRAWGAAAGWAYTDRAAARAADRVENRLRTIDPDSMAGYDQARAAGVDRIAAMRDVFAHRTGDVAAGRRVFVGDPAQAAPSTFAGSATTSATDGGRTAADIAAESYPTAYTAVATRRTSTAGEAPQQQTAARTRGLSR